MKRFRKAIALLLITFSLLLTLPVILPNEFNSISVQAATKIKINKTKAILIEGKTLQLKITGTKSKVIWSTNNKSVATVSTSGKVTAKKTGTATITATIDSKKYICKVTVKNAPKLVTDIITKSKSLNVPLNAQFVFMATPYPTTADNKILKWKSSDETIIKVDDTGSCLTVGEGNAVISASTTDGSNITAKWDITVTNDFSKLVFTASKDITMSLSEVKTIIIDYYSYLDDESLYYNQSNSILAVNWGEDAKYLMISPLQTGITYLTITSDKYLGEYIIKITVIDSPVNQTLTPTPTPTVSPTPIDNTAKIYSLQTKISSAKITLNSYKSTLASYNKKLSNAKMSLENAQTQKTISVIKNGQIEYEVDTVAISKAQSDVDEYQAYVDEYTNLVSIKESEINSLQAELDAIT